MSPALAYKCSSEISSAVPEAIRGQVDDVTVFVLNTIANTEASGVRLHDIFQMCDENNYRVSVVSKTISLLIDRGVIALDPTRRLVLK